MNSTQASAAPVEARPAAAQMEFPARTSQRESSQEHRSTDRRRRTRLASCAQGWTLPLSGDASEAWEVRISDVSRVGVGFVSSSSMQVGEVCRIRIGRGPIHLAKRLRIVSCRAGENATFHIGGEFVE